jgi:hypothetical protein
MFHLIDSVQPHMLTPFQRWALLYLHKKDEGDSGLAILKECCITAMTDNFQKKDVVDGLQRLTEMGLIKQIQKVAYEQEYADYELAIKYIPTADGIIYTKRMLKPVLELLVTGANMEKVAHRLTDGKTKNWLREVGKSASNIVQQKVLEAIIQFGLGNIGGLTQLLETIRQLVLHK